MSYGDFKDLARRATSDKVLLNYTNQLLENLKNLKCIYP